MTTTPEQFARAFFAVVKQENRSLFSTWRKARKYTAVMLSLMPEIARKLNLEVYNGDYYTLDTVFYENKDVEHFSSEATYAEYIAIALEHENEPQGTAVEMNKLQIINSPLKVLITYPNDNQQTQLLSMYSDIIRKADIFDDISTLRRQLVVYGTLPSDDIKWSFYEYRKGAFAQIHGIGEG